MTRFPNPVVAPASAQQHRFEVSPSPPSAFDLQPAVAASTQQQGGNQVKHDEALRQNALHRQMLAEVEERHREATLQVKLRFFDGEKMSNRKGSARAKRRRGGEQPGSRFLCWANQNSRHFSSYFLLVIAIINHS